MTTDRYRPDIDGIRALAVAVVVLFHLRVAGMHGGFIGVDIFFVLSGYLISGIILRGLEKGTFSLKDFYVRRINRIIPALLVILAATWMLGWLFMFAREFKILGGHVFGGSTFSANFILWTGLGYFDSPDKPLLHLWSLAVEEQFYILWPVTLLLVWKTKRNVRWTLIAIVEISFIVNMWQVRHSGGPAAFYLPLSRFWEILAGSLWYHIESGDDWLARKWRGLSPRILDAMSVAGVLLIGVTLAIAHPGDLWPSWQGVIPIVGTILLLASGPTGLVNRLILSHPLMVGLGLISYPLYLWHWPLIVMGKLVFENAVPKLFTYAVIPISLALATATYLYIEKPIRFGKRKRRSAVLLLPGLVATTTLGIVTYEGIVGPRLEPPAAESRRRWGPADELPQGPQILAPNGPPIFVMPGDESRTVVMYGDSHIEQYWPRVEELAKGWAGRGPKVLMMRYPGCPVLPETNNPGRNWNGQAWTCDRFNSDVFGYMLRPEVRTVVITGFWEIFVKDVQLYPGGKGGFAAFLLTDDPKTEKAFRLFEIQMDSLVKSGKRVYIMLSNPFAESYVGSLPRRLAGFNSNEPVPYTTTVTFLKMTRWTSDRLRKIAANTGVTIIDPGPLLCGPEICPASTPEGEPIYRDDNHFRSGFVRRHATWIDEVFKP
ncbi:MAG: acyltransferase family protein [Gemmatimonadales bacterium]